MVTPAKALLYKEFGIKFTYDSERQVVSVEADLSHGYTDLSHGDKSVACRRGVSPSSYTRRCPSELSVAA